MTAPKTHEAVGQDAAFEQGVEFVFDELRQVGPAAASVSAFARSTKAWSALDVYPPT